MWFEGIQENGKKHKGIQRNSKKFKGIWEDKENINLSIVLLLLDKEQLIIVRVYIINVAHGFSILKTSRYSNKAFRNMEALCQFTKM